MSEEEKSEHVTERQTGLVIAPGLAAQIQTMQQIAQQFVQTYIEPLRKTLKVFQEQIKQVVEWARQVVDSIIKPLKFLFTFKPVYYVPIQPVLVKNQKQYDRHPVITRGEYGFFYVDGQKINTLNPSTSRCGRLLAAIVKRRSRIVDYQTLRSEVGAGDLDKTFKDLKRQLKKLGYELDYDRPPTQGIAYLGLKYLQ